MKSFSVEIVLTDTNAPGGGSRSSFSITSSTSAVKRQLSRRFRKRRWTVLSASPIRTTRWSTFTRTSPASGIRMHSRALRTTTSYICLCTENSKLTLAAPVDLPNHPCTHANSSSYLSSPFREISLHISLSGAGEGRLVDGLSEP